MNTIPSITRSGYPVPPVKHTASAEKASKTNTDIFTSDASQEEIPCGDLQGKLSQEQIAVLSKQYDLHNMDRNQFSRLLAELRDSGVITAQERTHQHQGCSGGAGGAWLDSAPAGGARPAEPYLRPAARQPGKRPSCGRKSGCKRAGNPTI